MNLSAIGARIKEARLNKKLTQEQLAELADVGFYYIGEIERGQKLPSFPVCRGEESEKNLPRFCCRGFFFVFNRSVFGFRGFRSF